MGRDLDRDRAQARRRPGDMVAVVDAGDARAAGVHFADAPSFGGRDSMGHRYAPYRGPAIRRRGHSLAEPDGHPAGSDGSDIGRFAFMSAKVTLTKLGTRRPLAVPRRRTIRTTASWPSTWIRRGARARCAVARPAPPPPTLYEEQKYSSALGMTIDVDAWPPGLRGLLPGREQRAGGRKASAAYVGSSTGCGSRWAEGKLEHPTNMFLPMPASTARSRREPVCPVYAAYRTEEGLVVRSTTAASEPATAATTARTMYGASTGSSTSSRRRSRCN